MIATLQRQLRHVQARFSPDGWLGLHLTVGVIVIFACAIAFAEIARRSGAHEPIALLDAQVADWFHSHATRARTIAALTISFFGSVRFLSIATLATAFVLWRRQMWNRLIIVVLAMAGGSLLNLALKHAFHRQRPVFENPLVTLTSYGFPSGHTMGATIFYGLLALIALEIAKNARQRAAILLTVCVVIALIGTSRMYLGAHYFSDVTGAVAAGAAWLAFCWTGLETVRRRRASSGR
jgi:undecaprenyl-diphosphatase